MSLLRLANRPTAQLADVSSEPPSSEPESLVGGGDEATEAASPAGCSESGTVKETGTTGGSDDNMDVDDD